MSNALFFNNRINGSFYHNKINITPVCAGKGLLCPSLYTPMQLVSHITTIFDFITIPFLFYLSIAKVNDGIFKYFTLNLIAVCTLVTLTDLLADMIDTVDFYINVEESAKKLYQIRYIAKQFLGLGNIWFLTLALYAGVICYLPYANPLFYRKYFLNKSQKLHYIVLHISLTLWSCCITFIKEYFSVMIPFYITHITLFIALFIVVLMGSIEVYKYKPIGVNASSAEKSRRKRLFSFVIYSYATEIIALPRFFFSLILIVCAFVRCKWRIRQTVFEILSPIVQTFYEWRSTAIGVSTIVALEPYRHAVLAMFRKSSSMNVQLSIPNSANNQKIA